MTNEREVAPMPSDDQLRKNWAQVDNRSLLNSIDAYREGFERLDEQGRVIDVMAIRRRVARMRGLL